jgi:WD domain, G-beta repeat
MGRPILCLTTTHPSHTDASSSSSSTLGSGGGSMTLACPLTGSLLSSLRVTGDLAGKVPIGMHSLSLFPQDFCTATNANGGNNNSNTTTPPQQLAMAYGWSSSSSNSNNNNNNKEDSYAMLLTIRRQTATATSGTSDASAAASSLPPIVHWKCRIPEANLTAGLLVSTCGLYIVGGGASGSLYIWKSVGGGGVDSGGGQLIRTVPKAHYRSITTMTWLNSVSSNTRGNVNTATSLYLITGGADGMVHVFSLADLVSNNANDTIYPLRTWSRHHMPVTAVCSLGDRRLVTTSLDGQVLLLDLSSSSSSNSSTITEPSSSSSSSNTNSSSGGKALAALQLPHGIQSLVMDPHTQTLYAGSVQGTIYIIAWDEYAIYQVQQQQGVHVILTPQDGGSGNKRQKQTSSMAHQVFGGGGVNYRKKDQQLQDSKTYQTELSGHNRAVTSLALVNAAATASASSNSDTVLLCSGDEGGTLRIWDTTSRGCIHVVNPWSTNNNTTTANAAAKPGSKPAGAAAATTKKRHYHPITSIRVIVEDTPESVMTTARFGMAAVASTNSNIIMRGDKNTTSMVNLVTPLQKFATTTTGPDQKAEPTLLLRPTTALTESVGSSLFWDVARDSSRQRLVRKRQLRLQQERNASQEKVQQQHKQPKENDEVDYRAKAVALQKELDKAQATIQRWEAVNNKLMAQLQK